MLLRCLLILVLGVFFASEKLKAGEVRYRTGELIVKVRQPQVPLGSKMSGKALSAQANKAFISKIQTRKAMSVKGTWSNLNLHHLKVEDGRTVEQSLEDLRGMEDVEYAEPNYIVDKMDVQGPEGGLAFSLAQVLSFVGTSSFGMTGAAIQAEQSWAAMTPGKTPSVVAIIDTGVDLSHSVFTTPTQNVIWHNTTELNGTPGVDDDGNGYIDDFYGWNFVGNNNNPNDDEGHGTHVAGIIAGAGFDVFHVTASDTPKVQIMPLKFLDSVGSGATSDAIKAIYYAVNNGAKVMNNSWGGGAYSQALQEAIAYAYDKDVLFVAAAGNAHNDNDTTPTYPASYDVPNVISVAATDDYDYLAYFSNYGASTVHVASPGVSILSTYKNNQFAFLSGTSMAAPFVSGMAGMMRTEQPSMNSYQIRNLVFEGANQKNALSGKVSTSARVNLLNSVNLAKTTTVSSYRPSYLLSVSPQNRTLASSVVSRGGGCGTVSVVGSQFWRGITFKDKVRQMVVLFSLLLLPIYVIRALKKSAPASYKRRFDRFEIDSSVTFKVGEKEMVGSVRSISVGGSDLNTEALLSDGSTITMTIASPDGQSRIEVQGHVVWSQSAKRYGVAFDGVSDAIRSQIETWTKALQKAS